MSVDSGIVFEKAGAVVRLTINRPQVLNAMDIEAHEAFSQCLDRCEADPDVRVVVVTGAGERAFSVGRDLKAMAADNALGAEAQAALQTRWSKIRRLTDRHDFTKPIIARVNGLALGGGFEIALACEIIIATHSASFALPEAKRGLIPFAGGVHRLPRQVPLKIALGYLLTGRSMTSERAYELGLVNAVVAPADLDTEVERWASDIIACAPLAVRAIKQCVMQGLGRSLPAALQIDYPLEAARRLSADSIEGPRAFAQKRQPVWTGA
jgi:enoyl-CoA hydratase/carnithine racemase